jgi:hypothetical protein
MVLSVAAVSFDSYGSRMPRHDIEVNVHLISTRYHSERFGSRKRCFARDFVSNQGNRDRDDWTDVRAVLVVSQPVRPSDHVNGLDSIQRETFRFCLLRAK